MEKDQKLSSLSIFMPAFNEEGNIVATLADADKAAKDITNDYEIIVVDDGSTDQTSEIIEKISETDPHLKLVHHTTNRGYGAAVKTGLAACKKDWIFFTDSDGQFHYDELSNFVKATKSFDLIMGYRKKRMDPFHRVFVAQVLLKIWNYVLFGLTVRDVDCAYKLFSRQVRDSIELKTESAITVSEFIIKAHVNKFRIKQLPVTHYPRRFGEQTGGNWRVIVRAAFESFRLYKELHS